VIEDFFIAEGLFEQLSGGERPFLADAQHFIHTVFKSRRRVASVFEMSRAVKVYGCGKRILWCAYNAAKAKK